MISIKTEPDDTSAWEENSQRITIPGSHGTVTLGDTGKSFIIKTQSESSCLEGRGDDGVKKEESCYQSQEIESNEGTLQVTVNIDGDEFLAEESENGNDVVVKREDTDLAGCSLAPFLQLECHQKKHLVDHPESLDESSSPGNISICTSLPKSNAEGDHGMQINRLPQHLKGVTNEKKTNYHCNEDSLNEILQIGEKSIFHVENGNHCSQISTRELDVEQKVQSPQQLFKCESCKESFSSEGNYNKHQLIHTTVTPFECQFCEKKFSTVRHHKSHEITHTGVQCQYCGKFFTGKNRRHLKAHERIHTREKPFKCQFCEKSFTNTYSQKEHERTHTGEKPFKCQYCEKSFTRSSNRNEHERTHTGERPFKSHKRAQVREKPFKCHYCEKSYARSLSRKFHERTHTGERPFKCKFCEKSFTQAVSCKSHERVHTDKKPFKCAYCEKSFTNPLNCKVHERRHTGEKPFKCQFCEKSFSYPVSRKVHERTHTGERPFKCQFCEKSFTQVGHRNSHERIHRDKKPLKGPLCEKAKAESRKSQKRLHTSEKPFRVNCQFCKKSFRRKLFYEAHIKKHKFEKPFMCQFCGKLYNYELDCKSHERRHTQARNLFIDTTKGSLLPKVQVVTYIPVINPVNVSVVGSQSPVVVVSSHMQGHTQVAHPLKVISVGTVLPT